MKRILKRRSDGYLQRYWKGTWKHRRIPESQQRNLVKKFINKSLGEVKFKKDKCLIVYDKHMLEEPIEYKKKVPTIGNWKRRREGILIDTDVKPKNIKPLCVHETIESYMGKRYGLRYANAHKVATAMEKQYVHRQNKNWQKHQASILRTRT